MIVWKIEGDAIGANDNAAMFFATKKGAEGALREYRAMCKEQGKYDASEGPKEVRIEGREQLARALNDAMGYGS